MDNSSTPSKETCSAVYAKLKGTRDVYLERARECAGLTIPTLLMDEGKTNSTRVETPHQSVGSRGVNNLSSKLMMALFPPNTPFFKLSVDDFTLADLTGGDTEARAQVEKSLNTIERSVITELEGEGMRNSLQESMRHLIVTGNYLIALPKEGNLKGYGLDRYVVTRDPQGNLKDVIIHEQFAPETLDPELLIAVGYTGEEEKSPTSSKTIDVYTRYVIMQDEDGKNRKWHTYQEINNVVIEGTRGTYPIDSPPIMALRWTAVTGENYGRSHVEELFGDLMSLEGLTKAILDGSAAAARLLVLVNSGGTTRKQEVARAANGSVITGKDGDVTFVQTQKAADLRVAQETANRIEQRLAQAFILESSVTRDAERVTAEEIRMLSGMLENALGGVYSVLSSELQQPLVNRLMDRMQAQKKLPELPKGVIKPSIVTGLEALGRGHDLTKIGQLFQVVAQLGPQALTFINVGDAIQRAANSLGIDSDGLIKSQETIQAEQQQAMEAQMAQEIVKGGMGMAQQQAAQNQTPSGE